MLEDNDESQKLQARTLDGSTAPHCEHVFVTGAFCAADAPTPVRSEPAKNSTREKQTKAGLRGMFRISHQEITGYGQLGGRRLRLNLLCEHVAAESNAAIEGYCRKVSALTALHIGPGHQGGDDARQS